jgi:hypothetical protein
MTIPDVYNVNLTSTASTTAATRARAWNVGRNGGRNGGAPPLNFRLPDSPPGIGFKPDRNVVDVVVRGLRAKGDDPFETKLIHTIYGVGYVLKANVSC